MIPVSSATNEITSEENQRDTEQEVVTPASTEKDNALTPSSKNGSDKLEKLDVNDIPIEPPATAPELNFDSSSKTEDQISELNRNYHHLLLDKDGDERGRFIACPDSTIQLLTQVANSGKLHLYPVQSYTPNLVNKLFRTPGFPRKGAEGNSFVKYIQGGQKQSLKVQKELEDHLYYHLKEMKYCFFGQQIQFYFSYLATKIEKPQPAHIDFDWEVVTKEECATRKRKRGVVNGYKHRVPFVAFFPLTKDGMTLEIWKARSSHQIGEEGELVHIPFGLMLLLRGDAVHAGGYMNGTEGDLRGHLYIYREGGEQHDTGTSNAYTIEVDGKRLVLSEYYRHGART